MNVLGRDDQIRSPILCHGLPPELIIKFFGQPVWDGWKEILRLGHISRHLRAIAISMSQLWARALDSFFRHYCTSTTYPRALHAGLVSTFFIRSKNQPISEQIFVSLRNDRQCLWEHLEPHCCRLRSLMFGCPSHADVIRVLNILSRDTCALEHLVLCDHKEDDAWRIGLLEGAMWNKLVRWEDAKFPHLTTVRLPTSYFVNAVAVRTLQTVELLDDIDFDDDKIFDALERCSTSLQVLELPRTRSHDYALMPRDRRVTLPSLRTLRIPTAPSHPVLAHLSFDPMRTFIDVTSGSRCYFFGTTSLTAYQYRPPPCDRLYLQSPAPGLFREGSYLESRCFLQDTELLHIRTVPFTPASSSATFLRLLTVAAVTSLVVNVADRYIAERQIYNTIIPGLLQGLPNLRRLELLGDAPKSVREYFLEAFLRARASGGADIHAAMRHDEPLTLSWVIVVPGPNGADADSGVDVDMTSLRRVLQAHEGRGGQKLGRLELCVIARDVGGPPRYRVSELRVEHSYRDYVRERIVPRLSDLAHVVVACGM